MTLLLLACSITIELGDSGLGEPRFDTGETDDTDTDTDTDAETDSETAEEVSITGLSATVHEAMASIIVLTWTQSASANVHAEYSFDEEDWLISPTYALGAGDQRLLLLGIPFDTEVRWRLLVDGAAVADDAEITTGEPPAGMPELERVSGDDEGWDADVRWVLGSIAPSGDESRAWTFIVDRDGRMVWGSRTPEGRTTFAPRPSADGTEILIDYNSWWGSFDGGVNSQVARLDIEGSVIDRWDTPGLIHPFTQLDDGAIAWSAAQGGDEYSGEVLVVLDADGEPRTLFDCNEFSEARRGDDCGANALTWDRETGNYLLSLYTLDTVIEIDAEGEAVRWFGELSGAWEFEDDDTQFWWQFGAHYLEDGNLLVSARRTETAEETVIREYALDDEREELAEVWTFGEGEGVYADILGEARRLPNGNTLHNYGSATRMREVTDAGEVVWDIEWSGGGTLGCTHPLTDLYPFARE